MRLRKERVGRKNEQSLLKRIFVEGYGLMDDTTFTAICFSKDTHSLQREAGMTRNRTLGVV